MILVNNMLYNDLHTYKVSKKKIEIFFQKNLIEGILTQLYLITLCVYVCVNHYINLSCTYSTKFFFKYNKFLKKIKIGMGPFLNLI